MMQVMRNTVPEEEMGLSNPATKIYQGMLDSEVAQRAAHSKGVGLAEQIIAYMQQQSYNLPNTRQLSEAQPATGQGAPRPSTGGTHEGK
jgi:Rod binding domain-containing protein